MQVGVRFEFGSHGYLSKDYGPFEFVLLTRAALRGYSGENGATEMLLAWQNDRQDWHCPLENRVFSDVVIYQWEERTDEPAD